MKLKVAILFGLLFSGTAVAQDLQLDILPPSVHIRQDSILVSIHMTVNAPGMDSKSQVRLTPILVNENYKANLPQILLQGEKAHKVYRRHQAFNKRKGKKADSQVFTAIAMENNSETINYQVSLPTESWMRQAKLTIKKEVINGNGNKTQSEVIPIPAKKMSLFTPEQGRSRESVPVTPPTDTEQHSLSVPMSVPQSPTATVVAEHRPALSDAKHFKGSYVSPESDATDERNQKELNFSLDEARVIAEINPQMLSLRELYTVALSYKNDLENFYKVIDISVKIYPASPVANLNAAAAAIERGNIQGAGRYLQMASHETLAYKNCRGAYELLCNNTFEGIRLLKAAKAEGSEEAGYNLKLFFELNKTNIQ